MGDPGAHRSSPTSKQTALTERAIGLQWRRRW